MSFFGDMSKEPFRISKLKLERKKGWVTNEGDFSQKMAGAKTLWNKEAWFLLEGKELQ